MSNSREDAFASAAPLVAGQLFAFGPPTFSNPAVKVPTKPLILLAFVRLEGHRSRLELAQLFWPHLAGQRTKKGERKDFSNYSVARATLKRELGVDIDDSAHLEALPCDVKAFTQALGEERMEDALNLYQRGPLLQGIEAQIRLNLSAEFLDWLEAKRAALARLAQQALFKVAQHPRFRERARHCAEKTYEAERRSDNLNLLAQLHSVLAHLDSPLAFDAQRRLEGRLETLLDDEVMPESFRLYLALSLQGVLNLAAAQVALSLSPQAGAACLAELRSAELVSKTNEVLGCEVATFYFEGHLEEKMTLLRALADSTPVEQAFSIFRTLFETSHTFGGVGYWEKARAAYYSRASALAEAQDFQTVTDILGELSGAETDNQQPPHPKSRALEAYALGRLGHVQAGLAALEEVAETSEVLAVRAALLAHAAGEVVSSELNQYFTA